MQLVYFSLGLILGSLAFSGRLRFVTSFTVLLITLFIAYRFIDNAAVGEFDAFFLSIQFLVFAILFSLGIFLGWGVQRYAYFSIVISSFFFLLAIYLLSKTGEFTMVKIVFVLLPIIFYCIYLIFTANELYRFKFSRTFSWAKLLKRLMLFLIFILIVGASIVLFMRVEIKETIEQYGVAQANDDNSMLKKNKDGSVQNQDKMNMKKNNRRSNELVFCAYINNFFEGSDYPNPLYLTSYYFTKFDTLTETFERDPNMPYKDEYTPNPNRIPLFARKKNKKLLDSSMATKLTHEVQIEVYKKKLSADAFLAPNTAFEVQPITVEQDFQNDYAYAYRAKSMVSKMNSAYFIYNTDDVMINDFQEQRFKELRNAKNYNNIDKRFLDYYTYFPSSKKYRNFKLLADSLSDTADKTIDKVIAIRSYFKQKNPLGEAVYSYSDNPGIPGLPGASKLSTFMFDTKKGWCTYYAGSTLLMLRAMRIPSRIAVGFLTVDRSDNNKGWYWYYQDQAHAWVQVFFPEYGWLDFDMTIGNDEAQQSPTPDGTPPLQPPKAVVVASGEIRDLDTLAKEIQIQANHFIYKEKEFSNINKQLSINVGNAKIWKDSSQIKITDLKKEDYVVNVSYDEALGKYSSRKLDRIISKLPKPLIVDEVYLKSMKIAKKSTSTVEEKGELNTKTIIFKILLGILLLTLSILALPFVILKAYAYRYMRSKTDKQKAYRMFRYTTYYLNQMGYSQNKKTLNEFAIQDVEPGFLNGYTNFANLYQEVKFSSRTISTANSNYLQSYFSTFTKNIKKSIKPKERFKNFLNLSRTFRYFLSYTNN